MTLPENPNTWLHSPLESTETFAPHAGPLDERAVDHGVELGEELGRGGMGVVRAGVQTILDRGVAVKRLRPDAPAGAVQDLLREARVLGRLEHPAIVPLHDLRFDHQGAPELIMKRIHGQTLDALRADGAELPPEAVSDPLAWFLRVLVEVCNALRFAHSQGILHRDLKPENVMVGAFGEVYVLDWGVALGLGPDPAGIIPDGSRRHSVAGTPVYMAPEHFSADAPLGEASDVYLLAGLLFYVLSGRAPRASGSLTELQEASRQPPELDPGWPEDLRRLLTRSFAPEPEERPRLSDFRSSLLGHLDLRSTLRGLADAEKDVERLETLAGREPLPDPSVLYDLHGACRFAAEQVLRVVPGNAAAQNVLVRSVVAMVEFELRRQNPFAAEALLVQAPSLPDGLEARVRERASARRGEQERLHALETDLDDRTGRRARIAVFVAMFTGVVGLPLVLDLLGWERTAARLFTQAFANFAIVVGGWTVSSRWLRSSSLNRAVFLTGLVLPLGEVGALSGGLLLDLPDARLSGVRAGGQALVLITAAALRDPRVLPSTLQYGVAALLALALPLWAGPILQGSTFLLAVTVALIWTLADSTPASARDPHLLGSTQHAGVDQRVAGEDQERGG